LAALDDWTPVELFNSSNARKGYLLVPDTALDLGGAALPGKLLVRLRADGPGRPRVSRAQLVEGVPGETALKATDQLLRELKAPKVEYPAAEIKRASYHLWLRYDRNAQGSAVVAALSLAAAGWGIAGAVAGEGARWIKIVIAVLALLVLVGQQLKRS
jgi:hypothetical protein